MKDRRLKSLETILKENEFEIVYGLDGIIERFEVRIIPNQWISRRYFEDWERNVCTWPDNFYEEIVYMELKSIETIKREFFHRINDLRSIEFHNNYQMPVINDAMLPLFGKLHDKEKFGGMLSNNSYSMTTESGCTYMFHKRWFV